MEIPHVKSENLILVKKETEVMLSAIAKAESIVVPLASSVGFLVPELRSWEDQLVHYEIDVDVNRSELKAELKCRGDMENSKLDPNEIPVVTIENGKPVTNCK